MSLRQRQWAARAKANLIASLGGRCWGCSFLGVESTSPLEIDHPNGREWKVSAKEFSHRISIYRREAREGLVRVLCHDCNCSHRWLHRPLPQPVPDPELTPF